MALIPKPSVNVIWAEGGNQLEPASEVQELGFVVEKPPYEVVNWLHNKHDTSVAYLYQEGFADWDIETEYSNTSHVKYNGVIYKSKLQNTGKQPDANPDNWEVAFANYQDYLDLYQDLQDTKNVADHADNLVYKDTPVMTNKAVGTSFSANSGIGTNDGYQFNNHSRDGLFHNGTNPVVLNDGQVVVDFTGVQSLTESSKSPVTMDVLQQILKSLLPIGAIIEYPSEVIPSNVFMYAHGQSLSRTKYSELFGVIGTRYGNGDGVTTFNLPDKRGRFTREWDNNKGIDAGRVLGSTQEDQLQRHKHIAAYGENYIQGGLFGYTKETGYDGVNAPLDRDNRLYYTNDGSPYNGNNPQESTGARIGDETRVKNIAMVSLIRVK